MHVDFCSGVHLEQLSALCGVVGAIGVLAGDVQLLENALQARELLAVEPQLAELEIRLEP